MPLTAGQRKSAARRRAQLLELCADLPEVVVEPAGDGHLAFRIRKYSPTTSWITMATGASRSGANRRRPTSVSE